MSGGTFCSDISVTIQAVNDTLLGYDSDQEEYEVPKMTSDERRGYAQTMFVQHPELFPEDRRPAILNGVVEFGMTPFEARLAAGAFVFKVVADPNRWPEHSDPLKVMWAQSMLSDSSKIWMTFKNSTQFIGDTETLFRVYFEQGHAIKIEQLEGDLCPN